MQKDFVLRSVKITTEDGVVIRSLVTPGKKDDMWIVFLHGMGGDARVWKHYQRFFYDHGYPSAAIDLRGHGLSDDPPGEVDYSLTRMAEDVGDTVRSLGLSNVCLVGHCFGGMVAILVSAMRLTPLTGLVLVDTSYKATFLGSRTAIPGKFRSVIKKIAHLLPPARIQREHAPYEQYASNGDFNLRRVVADIRATSLKSYLLCCSNVLAYDATDLLSLITVPTLVVGGEKDSIFPPAVTRDLARRIVSADYAVIPNANHIVVISMPESLTHTLARFIERL